MTRKSCIFCKKVKNKSCPYHKEKESYMNDKEFYAYIDKKSTKGKKKNKKKK